MTRGTNYLVVYSVEKQLSELGVVHSNIHTHGLMIPGSANNDDITRLASPGECMGYNYSVEAEHAGGLCWYHSHPHGETDFQVRRGALGPLIITDQDPKGNWPQFPQDEPTTGLEALNSYAYERIAFFYTITNQEGATNWYVNGDYQESSIDAVPEDTWYRMRFLVSNPAGQTVRIEYKTESMKKCQFRMQAFDGHWVRESPLDQLEYGEPVVISAAGRVDVAFKCPMPDGPMSHHRLYLSDDVFLEIPVVPTPMKAKVTSSPWVDGQEGKPWKVNLPPWQQDLSSFNPDSFPSQCQLGECNDETEDYCCEHTVSISPRDITWDGRRYEFDPEESCDSFTYGRTYQLSLSLTQFHPYHLHAYPMQIQSNCAPHRQGEWYDTIAAVDTEVGTACVVRFKAQGEAGKTPMHCHLLRHEDAGAMTWANVIDGPSLPTEPWPPVRAFRCTIRDFITESNSSRIAEEWDDIQVNFDKFNN
jgi:FtsP/CotA-like multicopper oxidase with cupredoxin domain